MVAGWYFTLYERSKLSTAKNYTLDNFDEKKK